MASLTSNMTVVLDCLLDTWPDKYRGKVDTDADAHQPKYEQIYSLIYNKTRQRSVARARSKKATPTMNIPKDDELYNSTAMSTL